jgi:diketogulonate reductase-like aldo/keto reductase
LKLWNSFGSEHSADLVIVGQFKEVADAATVEAALNGIQAIAGQQGKSLRDMAMEAYKAFGVSDFSEADIEGMNLCHSWTRTGNQIEVRTEETEIQGILKVMLRSGGKIEVYSNHS